MQVDIIKEMMDDHVKDISEETIADLSNGREDNNDDEFDDTVRKDKSEHEWFEIEFDQ